MIPSTSPPSTWAEDVFAAGRNDAWKGRLPLKHGTTFQWADVRTDGLGNVLEMPLLRHKWCFGRPEVYIRQIKRTKMQRFHWGTKEVAASRCGSCKIATGCGKLAGERIESSPLIHSALKQWSDFCRAMGGDRQFSGVAGRYWQGFLQAIADHGPWSSRNDELIAEDAKRRLIEGRKADATRKSKDRAAERAHRRSLNLPPTEEFVKAALLERNERCARLEGAAGDATYPPSISKIRADHAKATAAFTADAWMVDALLREHGKKSNPSTIAKAMIRMGRNQDKKYPALRQRVENDLRRVRDCETGSPRLWTAFDFESQQVATELDQIMQELEDPLERVVRGW
ncbi:hypothetical protein K3177_09355 [Qipengyuania sp. GH25]|uniref:Uncharacterized protein n=1 Tax=Qipengyuania pacifica TaxID=2860199 RepID=A0ABS7JI38_9SPHN|nr:hypothetical protein [Qipengyuania aerophila]MBX7488721.1 hypothetical protein [Qipengyuania aerophila]